MGPDPFIALTKGDLVSSISPTRVPPITTSNKLEVQNTNCKEIAHLATLDTCLRSPLRMLYHTHVYTTSAFYTNYCENNTILASNPLVPLLMMKRSLCGVEKSNMERVPNGHPYLPLIIHHTLCISNFISVTTVLMERVAWH